MTFNINGKRALKDFEYTEMGEREAAIMYDKNRLMHNMEPVNILKAKV